MSRFDTYYGLDGHEVVTLKGVHEWGRMFESPDRIVAQTDIEEVHVSTVFLGVDHNFGDDGPPLLFETLIFRGPADQRMWRYSTWQEAEAGHAHAVKLVKRVGKVKP